MAINRSVFALFSLSPWWRLEHSVEMTAKLFSELKLVTDNLLYLCSSQLRSHCKWREKQWVCLYYIRHGLGQEVAHMQRGTTQHPNVMGSISMKLTGNWRKSEGCVCTLHIHSSNLQQTLTCEVVLTVAPAWSSTLTTLGWPFLDATIRGVYPP